MIYKPHTKLGIVEYRRLLRLRSEMAAAFMPATTLQYLQFTQEDIARRERGAQFGENPYRLAIAALRGAYFSRPGMTLRDCAWLINTWIYSAHRTYRTYPSYVTWEEARYLLQEYERELCSRYGGKPGVKRFKKRGRPEPIQTVLF